MDDLIAHQEAPHTWSWTGRFAQFLPMQATRSIHCAFNPAKGVQGLRGFWLRSASLCSLNLSFDPAMAACTMSVFLKGQLHWEVCLTSIAVQCCLLSPEDTQQGWVLAAAVHDRVEVPAKCCFQFEGDGQSCAAVLQHIREQRVAHLREQQRQNGSPAAALQHSDATAPDRRDPAHATAEGAAAVQRHAVASNELAVPAQPPPGKPHADLDTVPDVAQKQPHLQPLGALPPMSDAALTATVKEHMADPAFRSLVDRVEALWDELGLPDG